MNNVIVAHVPLCNVFVDGLLGLFLGSVYGLSKCYVMIVFRSIMLVEYWHFNG